MEDGQKISVSTQELIEVLAQSGSNKRVREFAEENNISKKEIDQIIVTTQETKVNNSGNHIVLLKNMVNSILNSNKMIRFENGDHCLLIYPSEGAGVILEDVHKNQHTFSQFKTLNGLNEIICNFYGVNSKLQEDPVKINIELSNDMYDLIHNKKSSDLDRMIEDQSIDSKIRLFLRDFKKNNQQVSKITFKKRKIEKNLMQLDFVMLFVPGENNIWHINYEETDNNQIFLMSNSVSHYFNTLHNILDDFLQNHPQKNKKVISGNPKEEIGNFSFKRGLSFFWKSNLLLFIVILFFFINKSSWSQEGASDVLLFALLWEAVILLLSFCACLKKKDTPVVKKVKSA